MARTARRAAGPARPHTPLPSRTASPANGSSTPSMPAMGQVQSVNWQGGSSAADLPPAWASDPILMQIQALAQQNTAAAEAGALAARQQALISFGYDQSLDSSGAYGDQNTADAAKQNPFSTLQNLKRVHDARQNQLNENLNKQNLFYSSTRGKELGNEATQYLGEQYNANQALQSNLGNIANNLLTAKQSAAGQVEQGQQDAYTRYLQNSLQNVGGVPAVRTAVRAAPLRNTIRRP